MKAKYENLTNTQLRATYLKALKRSKRANKVMEETWKILEEKGEKHPYIRQVK